MLFSRVLARSLRNFGSTVIVREGHSGATRNPGEHETVFDKQLSHVDRYGNANMVDVGSKEVTHRSAKAVVTVRVGEEAFRLIMENQIKKGDVLTVAELAGIMGAKQTSNLIPLCHHIHLTKVDVNCSLHDEQAGLVRVECVAQSWSKTGVEMEALTGASIAALTVYDMCKAISTSIVIDNLHLVEKTGGKKAYYATEDGFRK